ncbi:MAG: alanine--glyoxylate aminotransferase family protein [Dehalococcoidia bacterium]|nr:alanine--glyoxylate aminotransferase family protein [Dehalococcoidia bacterium]
MIELTAALHEESRGAISVSVNLRIPGPTPLPDPVLKALSGQMINHRGPEFATLIAKLTEDLKKAFATTGDVVILTASGTGGLEAAVTNTISPGERCLVVSIGVFGDRVFDIAKTYGADPVKLSFLLGQAADPDKVRQALNADAKITTVFVTHNETSTGVTNDLGALAKVIKGEFGKTLVVDGISSIGSVPCPVDAWGLDVAVSGSQKGWMTPPGLAMVSVSKHGWDVIAKAKTPRFYFDLVKAKQSAEKGQTPWTPAVSVYYALDAGLKMMFAEGLEATHQRHARIGAHTRAMVKRMGFKLFAADERYASNTVTACHVPEGVTWKQVSERLRNDHQTVLAGGQGPLMGKIFRIGHLGWVNEKEIDQAGVALEKSLAAVGHSLGARSS